MNSVDGISRLLRMRTLYKADPVDSFRLDKDTFRIAATPDGHLFSAEIGSPHRAFSDGAISVYKKGRRSVLEPMGFQVLGLTSAPGQDDLHFTMKNDGCLYCRHPGGDRDVHDSGSTDVTGLSIRNNRMAMAERTGREIAVCDLKGSRRLAWSLKEIPYQPMDVCWLDDKRLLIAMAQLKDIQYPLRPFALLVLDMETGEKKLLFHLKPENGGRNCWGVCAGPDDCFFVLGSGRLWKLDPDLKVIFTLDLSMVCVNEPENGWNRPGYFATRRTPLYFSLVYDGMERLYVSERNLYSRVFVFKVK
jgi:hypothetical protein